MQGVASKSVFELLSLQTALDMMQLLIGDLSMATSIADLREYEVMAATLYYPALGSLLPKEFDFQQRKKQPPNDSINILMNLGHTLLGQTIYSAMQQFRLPKNFSNLDRFYSHHSQLACNFMAEFRPVLVDELVADLASSLILTSNDFTCKDTLNGNYLYPKALKIFLKHWEKKLETQAIYPYAGKATYRHCVKLQVQEYIACLRGDVEFYRPMLLPAIAPTQVRLPADTQKAEQPTLVKR